MSKQLEEARKLAENVAMLEGNFSDQAKRYLDKYHPKDELLEKWKEFCKIYWPNHFWEGPFNKAKELGLFTVALDEAINEIPYIRANVRETEIMEAMKEIRNKYSTEEG